MHSLNLDNDRAVSAVQHQLRNQLYLHGQQLFQRANRLLVTPAADTQATFAVYIDRATMLGELKQYVALRETLATRIGSDGLTRELRGTIVRLERLLTPPVTPTENAQDE